MFKYQKTILFVLGLFSALAFAPWFFIPVLVVSLSYLMAALNRCTRKKQALGLGFWFGMGLGITSLFWINHALMIDSGAFAVLIPITMLGLGLAMGICWMVPAFLAFFAPKGVKRWIAFACFCVLGEWLRSFLLTGFPWNLVGSVWTFCPPVLQFASVFGVYGLSFVSVLAFSSFGLLPQKKPAVIALGIMACVGVGGALRLYEATPENVFGVKVRLVQPNIQQSLKWNAQRAEDNVNKLIHLSRENNKGITHVIWPESAVPYLIELHPNERLRLMGALGQGATLITGALRVVDSQKRQLANSIFILNDLADIVGYYDKSHLVPFGEYVPFRGWLPLEKIVPIDADFVAGKGVETKHVPKAPPASFLVCYEVIFPHEVVETKRRPEWLINVTNDGWYGNSAGPYQHLGMAQMRAVEEGLPLARAANTGVSALIDPYGNILKSLPLETEGVVDYALPRAISPTIYSRFGNAPLLVLLLLGLGFVLFPQKNKEEIKKSA